MGKQPERIVRRRRLERDHQVPLDIGRARGEPRHRIAAHGMADADLARFRVCARIAHEGALRQPVHMGRMHGDAGHSGEFAPEIADAARIAQAARERRANGAVEGIDADGSMGVGNARMRIRRV